MSFKSLLEKSPFESNAANAQLLVSAVTGVTLMYLIYNKTTEQPAVDMSSKVVAGIILLILTGLSVYVSAYHIECVMYGKCNTFAWVLVALSVFNIFSLYSDKFQPNK